MPPSPAPLPASPGSIPPSPGLAAGTLPPAVHGGSYSSITGASSSDNHDFDGDSSGSRCSSRRERVGGEDVLVVVQFKWGRLGDFKCNLPLSVGTAVLVEADRGTDLGIVQSIDTLRNPSEADWRVIREADEREQERWQNQLVTRELAAKTKAQTILDEAGIDLQVQHAEYQFDKKKLTFHYTSSETRPNFRSALDDLFAAFRCRVWFARYSGEAMERDRANEKLVEEQTRRSSVTGSEASERESTEASCMPSPLGEVGDQPICVPLTTPTADGEIVV